MLTGGICCCGTAMPIPVRNPSTEVRCRSGKPLNNELATKKEKYDATENSMLGAFPMPSVLPF